MGDRHNFNQIWRARE